MDSQAYPALKRHRVAQTVTVHVIYAVRGGLPPDAPKTAKEAAREAQLQEEERVRARVAGVKERTERVLAALGMAASGNPTFCHDQLPDLVRPLHWEEPFAGESRALVRPLHW